MALQLLEVVGIFWRKMSFAFSAIMLHARYLLLWATARAALRAGWIFAVSHPPFTVSEMIRNWFDCNTGNLFNSILWHGHSPPTGDFPLAFPSACTIFSSALWKRHRTWDVAFAASLWATIWSQHTGLAGCPSACLAGPVSPQLETLSTPLSWDPLPLVHREIFARPCASWASKLTRPWWIFSAAGQALKDVWLTVSWDVSEPPTVLRHLEAALHSLLISQFSPWFPQALRVVIKRGFCVPSTVPTCKGS